MADLHGVPLSPTDSTITYVGEILTPTKHSASKADAYNSLAKFYSDNEALLSGAANALSSKPDSKALDTSINNFHETSKIVLRGLDSLSDLHPYIAVAVVAFKLVLELDIKRRENNEKVLAVRVLMQDTMCTLFQLRNIRDPEEVASDGTSLQARFQDLVRQIAEDVKNCGSACEVYTKKSLLARTLKSKIYEGRLAEWGDKFIVHKATISSHIQMHVAFQMSSLHDKIDQMHQTLSGVSDKLDVMQLFRRLDSPKEKELSRFIEDNGGARVVVDDVSKLERLISKSGESMQSLGGDSDAKHMEQQIISVQRSLKQELAQNVEDLFRKNMDHFGRKLDMLSNKIGRDSSLVIRHLSGGSHDRIKDRDFRAIWKEMGWKGSVKGRHLVLMLKDYFSDKEGFISKKTQTSDGQEVDEPPPTPISPMPSVLPTPPEEQWALQHITIANLQPISEAIDDDATGFVNVNEVNVFSEDRPQGWSLLKWLAYWAAGHHMNVTTYRDLLYGLIRSMNLAVSEVRPENRYYVETVLHRSEINRVELALRGTQPYPRPRSWDSELSQIAEEYRDKESKRLKESLSKVKYQLDDPSTVTIVAGSGRIEKHFWPLVYLVLSRLQVLFNVARRRTVKWSEFETFTTALFSIFRAVDDRVSTLRATFRHANLDADAQLTNFAFGMFKHYIPFGGSDTISRYRIGNTVWDQPHSSSDDNVEDESLNGDPHDALEEENVFSLPDSSLPGGTWTGHFLSIVDSRSVSIAGLMELRLQITEIPPSSVAEEDETLFVWDPPKDIHDGPADCTDAAPTDNGNNGSAKSENANRPVFTLTVPGGTIEESAMPEDLLLAHRGLEVNPEDVKTEKDTSSGQETRLAREECCHSEPLTVTGVAESIHGLGEVKGQYRPCTANHGSLRLIVTWPSAIILKSQLAVNKDFNKLQGNWYNPDFYDPSVDDSSDDDSSSSHADHDVLQKPVIEKDDEYAQPSGFATFSRIPARMYRHYPRQEQLAGNRRIKALWLYAKNVVLEDVRRRISPGLWFMNCALETNKFIKLQYRRRIATSHISPSQPLTSDELYQLREYRYRFLPQGARYVNTKIVLDSITRMPWQMGYTCDWCTLSIAVQRSTCVNCILPDWSNTMDLCPSCLDKLPTRARDGVVHLRSHTLLRRAEFMQSCEYAYYIPKAEQAAKRTKSALRDKTGKKATSKHKRSERMICQYCKEAVKPPFWVCLDCENDTYICKSCDIKQSNQYFPAPIHLQRHGSRNVSAKESSSVDVHSSTHAVIRITDAAEDPPKQDAIALLKETVDHRLNTLENRMERMENLFSKLFTHLTGTQPQVETLAIPLATPKPRKSSVERSRSRVGRRGSITESEFSFKAEVLS